MKQKRLQHELVVMGIACLVTWGVTTFVPIIILIAKGGLKAPPGPSVSRQTHLALLELTESLFYGVIPGLVAGYLIFGLYLLKYAQKAAKQERSHSGAG